MAALALGGLALLLFLLSLRGFLGANVNVLARGLRYFGAFLLLAAAVGCIAIDRPAVAMLALGIAWGLFTGGHVLPRGWHFPHRSGSASAKGGSNVRTDWLDMQLDHTTGAMTGNVLAGRYAGHPLDDLKDADLANLWREISDDDASLRLLEAYLDRRMPDWRGSAHFSARPASGQMSREEALAVLGLFGDPGEEEIRAAHRRLILQNHPDRGGTSYLAAKINEAKDVLLKR